VSKTGHGHPTVGNSVGAYRTTRTRNNYPSAPASVHTSHTTPGGKSEFHFATPSTRKVDSNQGNTPKVDTACSKARCNNVFLYHETLLKRNVSCEILTSDLARSDKSLGTLTGQRAEIRVVKPTVLITVGRKAPRPRFLVGAPLGPYGLP
jgi:hypothetical protein